VDQTVCERGRDSVRVFVCKQWSAWTRSKNLFSCFLEGLQPTTAHIFPEPPLLLSVLCRHNGAS